MSQGLSFNPAKKKKIVNRTTFAKLLDEPRIINLIHKQYTQQIKSIIKNTSHYQRSKNHGCYCYDLSASFIFKMIIKFLRAFISLYAVVIYILSTYHDNEDNNTPVNRFIYVSELTVATFISLDLVLSFTFSKKKWKYITNLLVLIDICIVTAIFLAFIIEETKNIGFARIFRFIRVIRVLRIFKSFQNPRESNDFERDGNLNLIYTILNVLSVLFISSGIIHFLVNNFSGYVTVSNTFEDAMGCSSGRDPILSNLSLAREGFNASVLCSPGDSYSRITSNFTFDIAFYYTVITLTSTGYGDIFPSGSYGRAILACLIFIFVVIFSVKINQLHDLIKVEDTFKQSFSGTNHIVISGIVSKNFLMRFIMELNSNYILQEKKMLIISQEYPSKEIQYILNQYSEIIYYYVGDLFHERTVEECRIENAHCIFLISDPPERDIEKGLKELELKEHDQLLILACKFFSKFTIDSKIFCQFHKPQSLLHNWAGWDLGFSAQQIQMAMMCKNGYIDGFITMTSNLISKSHSFYCEEVLDVPWISEYVNGAMNKLFIVEIPNSFFHHECEVFSNKDEKFDLERIEKTINYAHLVKKFLLQYDILVIGVKTKIKSRIISGAAYEKIYLNPFGYNIKEQDQLIIICSDKDKLLKILNNTFIQAPPLTTTLANLNFGSTQMNNITSANFDNIRLEKKISSKKLTDESRDMLLFSKTRYFKIWDDQPEEFYNAMNNHFLLYSPEERIEEFMSVFQELYDDWVFYVSDTPPTAIWEKIKDYFPKLIYIESSFSDVEDFSKLNLKEAKHIFVFSWKIKNSSSDSGILPIVKIFEEAFPDAKCTIELEDEENLKFLNNTITKEEKPKDKRGSITFRAFYNSAKKLMIDFEKIPIRIWPKYAKSDIFFSSFNSTLPAIFYHQPETLEILIKILGIHETNYVPDSPEDKEMFEHDYELSVFDYNDYDRIRYEDICKFFLSKESIVLPVAVYRALNNTLMNSQPYIVTNPKKDMLLQRGDKIIAFCRTNFMNDTQSIIRKESKQLLKPKTRITQVFSNIYGGDIVYDQEELEAMEDWEVLEFIKKEFEDLRKLNDTKTNLREILIPKPDQGAEIKRKFSNFISSEFTPIMDVFKLKETEKIDEVNENELEFKDSSRLINIPEIPNGLDVVEVVEPIIGSLKKKNKKNSNKEAKSSKKLKFVETAISTDKTATRKKKLSKKLGMTLKMGQEETTKKRLSKLFDFNLNNAFKEDDSDDGKLKINILSFDRRKSNLDDSNLTENNIVKGLIS